MTAEPTSHKARIELFQERARTTSGTLQGGLAVVALLALLVVQLPGTAWGKSLFIGETCLVYNSPAVELAALGFFDSITEFDLSGGTPTLPQLQAHDVALIYTNCTPFDPNSLGDVLADYVDAGGRIVVATYSFSTPWGISGRVTTPGYLPLVNVGSNGDVSGSFNAVSLLDPVFSSPNAITPAAVSYFHNSNFSHPALDSGAMVLADDGSGIPLFAINGAQTVGGLNMFPEGGDYGGNNDGFYRFLENTLVRVRFLCNNDGILDPGEECDDGNMDDDDGCSHFCRIEPCYSCTGEPSTCSMLPDGSDCNDQEFCNGTDSCSGGACTVHTGDPCTGGFECNNVCDELHNRCAVAAGTSCTDDGEVCTDDVCDGLGMCTHPGNYFVPCDDGLFCDGDDYCYGGTCSYHTGDPCSFSECNDLCDEISVSCLPSTSGTQCFDDGNVCTNDQCDGSGSCVHPPVTSGTPCPDDGSICTSDQCDGLGSCVHPAANNGAPCPDDGNECTNDQCNGGLCAHPPVTNGTPCNDSNPCTQTDQCEAGQCVGSNPIVCPAPLCHAAETCDPSSGACTTCPAGYTLGIGGCQKTYAIDATLLDNQDAYCDGTGANRYNDCDASPFGFHWTDAGDASVGEVTRLDVQIEAGFDCDSLGFHSVTLNAASIGEYAVENECYCVPYHAPRLFPDADSSAYVKGGANTIQISGGSCNGLSQDTGGHYALVTVTYADLGLPLAMQTGCGQAAKSKLKYTNDTSGDKDKLQWKWSKGAKTDVSDLADPTTSADYQLCVFGETSGSPTLLFSADVPHSSTLWDTAGSSGYKYKDKAASHDGIAKILAKGGAEGKSKILVKGQGAGLSDPSLPLAPAVDGIRVQLMNESSGVCWESEFPISNVTSDSESIKAKVP